MVRNESLCVGVVSLGCRECGIAFIVHAFVLEDTPLSESRIHVLADTPAGVEEVKDVLDIKAELKSVDALADINLEIVLIAEVDPVDPRRVDALSLGILALTLAQVLVVVDIVHEAVTVIV